MRNSTRLSLQILISAMLASLVVTFAVAETRHDPQRQVLRGSIERIDYAREQLFVREERTDRLIRVNFEGDLRMFRFRNLQRGDLLQVSGAWLTPGLEFNAYRIEELSLR